MENQETVYKVAIGVPNEAYILPEAYENHIVHAYHIGRVEAQMQNEKRNPRYEFYRYSTGRLLTPMARERLLTTALDNKMDYILMMDNDMLYPIDFVENLLKDMEEHPEIDILAPLAFMRNTPHSAVMYTTLEGYDKVLHKPYFYNEIVKNYPRNKLVECDAVGFGAVLINTRILKKMREPFCFSTTGSGEDIYFCIKAKNEAKARIFMDTRIKLGHMGKNIVIDEEYHDKFNKENNIEIADIPHKYLSYER